MKKIPRQEELYEKFLNNEATGAELNELMNLFGQEEEAELRSLITKGMEQQGLEQQPYLGLEQHLSQIHDRISAKIDEQESPVLISPLYTYPIFRIVASILLIAFVGFFTYRYMFSNPAGEQIKPACNCASLLTEAGTEIKLEAVRSFEAQAESGVIVRKTGEGQLVYSADASVAGSSEVMNTLQTPLGGKYKVRLSDGTLVFLNSGSRLEFPVGFHGDARRVKLSGEAYFEVSKDPMRPFIVQLGAATIKVLGTKFNVSNYAEDGVQKTTLIEGKIQFSSQAESHILKPGEQASLSNTGVDVSEVDSEDAIAWKNDLFVFKNEELSVIMRELSRWYDIEVDYSTIPSRRLYVRISRDVNLSEVLSQFALTSNIRFKVEGRRVSFVK